MGFAGEEIRAASTAERANEALELRKQRLSYREVAKTMGISVSYAHDLVKEAIASIPRENAEAVLEMELATLDRLEAHYLPMALLPAEVDIPSRGENEGRPVYVLPDTTKNAALMVMKVLERRAKYLGLDAPEKKELTGANGAPLNGPAIYVPPESED